MDDDGRMVSNEAPRRWSEDLPLRVVRGVGSLPARARERWRPVREEPRKLSYSQSGEDLILAHLLHHLHLEQASYVDLGAHHPLHLNNTALMYEGGSRGVNVEPDPSLIPAFEQMRPGDVNLNVAVGAQAGHLDFYVMSAPTLNTLSYQDAMNSTALGYSIEKVLRVPVLTVAEVFSRLPGSAFPDVLSVDVEGLDLEILRSVDFTASPVPVVCVETLSHSHFGFGEKSRDILELMRSRGYAVYADTYLNTVFIREQSWRELLRRGDLGDPRPLGWPATAF